MKTKSHKLESLPPDLKDVADELIADKFPEPEVIEPKKESYTTYGSGPSLQFPYADQNVLSNMVGDFSPTLTTTYNTRATKSTIDEHSLQRLQQYQGMGNSHQIRLSFRVDPIGEFPTHGMDRHILMEQLRGQAIDVTISGEQLYYIEIYLKQRLLALEKLYQGYFCCSLESEEVRMIDGYGRF